MKVCVLMFYDNIINDYAEFNNKINKLYCEKYELGFIVSHKKTYKERHSAWERLPLILNNITNYDYVIWIDADAYFNYDSPNIIEVIEKTPTANFIFSNDKRNDHVNSGFFIVKNSEYSINFIKLWAYNKILYKNNPYPEWWDQGVLIDIINKNLLDIKKNCIIYEYGFLQYFKEEEYHNFKSKFNSIPFVHHMAGQNKNLRIKASKKYFNKLNAYLNSKL